MVCNLQSDKNKQNGKDCLHWCVKKHSTDLQSLSISSEALPFDDCLMGNAATCKMRNTKPRQDKSILPYCKNVL